MITKKPWLVAICVGLGTFILATLWYAGEPRIRRVHVGMSIDEVEHRLGKPTFVSGVPAHLEEQREVRTYKGDWGARINITFDDGKAVDIDERIPRRSIW